MINLNKYTTKYTTTPPSRATNFPTTKYSPKHSSTSFTLIELLVVVAIMGLLAAVGMVTFNHVQAKARDAKREADLEAIATAMELSMTTENSYPDTSSNTYCLETACSGTPESFCSQFQTYMPDIPSDPLNGSSNDQCYLFSSDGSNYRVATQLEKNDSRMSSDSGIYLYFMERASDFTAITLSDWTDVWQGDLGGFVSYLDDYLVGRWSLSEDDQVREGVWFDGSNDYISTATATNLSINSATSPFSIAFWFKTNDAGEEYLFDNYNVVNSALSIRIDGGKMETWIRDDAGNHNGNPSPQYGSGYNDDSWHYFVFLWDGAGTETIYVDNSDLGSTNSPAITGSLESNTAFLFASRPSSPGYFSGQISDFRIYNRELTSGEITQLYNGTEVSSGLTNHWILDDETGTTATDSAGSSNGTLTGGPLWSKDIEDLSSNSNNGTVYDAMYTTGHDGTVNGALIFDGADDYVNVGTTNDLNMSTEVSVSVWVKQNTAGDRDPAVSRMNDISPFYGYEVGVRASTDKAFFHAGGTYASNILYGDTTLNTEDWYHLVGVYDGTNSLIYVNGVEDGSAERTNKIETSGENCDFGTNYNRSQDFTGSIGEIRIYNRTLTDDEVMAIYMGTD